jgi:hypothetical protein
MPPLGCNEPICKPGGYLPRRAQVLVSGREPGRLAAQYFLRCCRRWSWSSRCRADHHLCRANRWHSR